MRKLRLTLLASLLLAAFALPIFAGGNVLAVDEASKNAACEGLGLVGENCEEAEAGGEVDNLVAAAINILSWIVGIAAIIMIIIGGFKYITANGDSNSISSAKSTLLYAIVGIVVAASAQVLVRFVLDKTT